jgi:hypothetical protein
VVIVDDVTMTAVPSGADGAARSSDIFLLDILKLGKIDDFF